mgnify:CR=1 FL=1|jgi:hypothetical protein
MRIPPLLCAADIFAKIAGESHTDGSASYAHYAAIKLFREAPTEGGARDSLYTPCRELQRTRYKFTFEAEVDRRRNRSLTVGLQVSRR